MSFTPNVSASQNLKLGYIFSFEDTFKKKRRKLSHHTLTHLFNLSFLTQEKEKNKKSNNSAMV